MKRRLNKLFPNERLNLTTWQLQWLIFWECLPILGIAIVVHQSVMSASSMFHIPKIGGIDPVAFFGIVLTIAGLGLTVWQSKFALQLSKKDENQALADQILATINGNHSFAIHEIEELRLLLDKLGDRLREAELLAAQQSGILKVIGQNVATNQEKIAEGIASMTLLSDSAGIKKRVGDLEEKVFNVQSKCIQTNHCSDKVCNLGCK